MRVLRVCDDASAERRSGEKRLQPPCLLCAEKHRSNRFFAFFSSSSPSFSLFFLSLCSWVSAGSSSPAAAIHSAVRSQCLASSSSHNIHESCVRFAQHRLNQSYSGGAIDRVEVRQSDGALRSPSPLRACAHLHASFASLLQFDFTSSLHERRRVPLPNTAPLCSPLPSPPSPLTTHECRRTQNAS